MMGFCVKQLANNLRRLNVFRHTAIKVMESPIELGDKFILSPLHRIEFRNVFFMIFSFTQIPQENIMKIHP